MKRARIEGIVGVVLLCGVLALALVLAFARGGEAAQDDAITSSEPNGRRALALLLGELGFQPRTWDASPSSLPRGHALLWLTSVPTQHMPGAAAGPLHTHEGMKRFGLHALDHYREFVERGGTLMMRAGSSTLAFLADDLGFEDCRGIALESGPDVAAVCRVRTSTGEELEVDVPHGHVLEPLDPNGAARELWGATCDGATRPFVVEIPHGAGAVVLVADDTFARNGTIGKHDDAIAAVRLVEDEIGDGQLLLDEYELGHWSPPSLLGLAFSPVMVLATLNLVLCLTIFVWMNAFARAFPRDPQALELFSPILRARSLGGLLARARRYRALGALLRRGMFAQLARSVPGGTRALQREGARTEPAGADRADAGELHAVTSAEVDALVRGASLFSNAADLERVFVKLPSRSRAELDALEREITGVMRAIQRQAGSDRATAASDDPTGRPAGVAATSAGPEDAADRETDVMQRQDGGHTGLDTTRREAT